LSGYLIDTNVLSELTKPFPNSGVVAWMRATPSSDTFVSTITIGEIEHGIALLPEGKKRRDLVAWLESLERAYGSRVLPVDSDVAKQWGRIVALARKRGRPVPVIDALIAATAIRHGLAVANRNAADAANAGAAVFDPWSA
jgi:predicted nucleic acid-binding protein